MKWNNLRTFNLRYFLTMKTLILFFFYQNLSYKSLVKFANRFRSSSNGIPNVCHNRVLGSRHHSQCLKLKHSPSCHGHATWSKICPLQIPSRTLITQHVDGFARWDLVCGQRRLRHLGELYKVRRNFQLSKI